MQTVVYVMSAPNNISEELKKIFSDPRQETLEGVLVAGGRMTPELLAYAYNHGVFPWPHEGYPLLWFCPDERGVLDFSDLHFPKSYLKWERNNKYKYEIKFNTAFVEVMKNCKSAKRAGQKGSWINQEILLNYQKLHELKKAESIEIWLEGKLVGGLYGVRSDKYFSCESMFHLEDNVSKLAFVETVHYLKKQGQQWMDIQMVTSVCESFGGKLITKAEFLTRIGC